MRREETFRYGVILENPRQMGKSDLPGVEWSHGSARSGLTTPPPSTTPVQKAVFRLLF